MQLFISSKNNAVLVTEGPDRPSEFVALQSNRASFLFIAVALMTASIAKVEAAQKNELEISLVAQRVVVKADGSEALANDSAAEPGDTVQYTASYFNKSAGTLTHLAPTLPIPKGTEYIPQANTPYSPSEGSLDGMTFEHLPIHRSKKTADGVKIVIEVPTREIRALRWQAGDLPSSGTFVAAARVRVLSTNFVQP